MTGQIDWLAVLRRAASAGRRAILANYDITSRRTIVKRGVGGDMTLRIDEASESAIHKSLIRDLGRDSFVFVSEELGETKADSDDHKPVVVCDPLDGSHNAQVGIPLFSLSLCVLGVKKKLRPSEPRRFGDVDVGLVQSIPSEDEWAAIRSEGAFRNGTLLKGIQDAMPDRFETLGIECGDIDYLKELLTKLKKRHVYKMRILGSAAVSLSLLADGTLDGLVFAQPGGARSIDSPAGYLIAKEGGCVFSDLSGKVKDLDKIEVGFHSKVNIVAARTAKKHRELLRLVRQL